MPEGLRGNPLGPRSPGSIPPFASAREAGGNSNAGSGTFTVPGGGTLASAKALRPGESMSVNPAAAAYVRDFDRWLDKCPLYNMPDERCFMFMPDSMGVPHEILGEDIRAATRLENGKMEIAGLQFDISTFINLRKQLNASERGFEREMENWRLAGSMRGFC